MKQDNDGLWPDILIKLYFYYERQCNMKNFPYVLINLSALIRKNSFLHHQQKIQLKSFSQTTIELLIYDKLLSYIHKS